MPGFRPWPADSGARPLSHMLYETHSGVRASDLCGRPAQSPALFYFSRGLFIWSQRVLVAVRRAFTEARGALSSQCEDFPPVAARGLRSWGVWVEPTVLKQVLRPSPRASSPPHL